MARPARPERNRTARSFHQLRRFHRVINSDKVFGTHRLMTRPDVRPHRPAIEIADILRRHGDAYRRDHAGHLGRVERRVMSAIEPLNGGPVWLSFAELSQTCSWNESVVLPIFRGWRVHYPRKFRSNQPEQR